jgi:acyl carrier protein
MTNNADTILKDVIKLLSQFLKQDIEITESQHLMRDLELDSVMVMELMMELEDHFDISIPLNSLPDVTTVADLATEISKLKNQ